MFTITVDNKLRIKMTKFYYKWPVLLDKIKRDMEVPNPEYAAAVKHNRSTRGIPVEIILWRRVKGEGMVLPRGYLAELLRFLRQENIPLKGLDLQVTLPPVDFRSRIELRDYQEPAVDTMLNASQGVLQAPAGSGKTQIGLELIARLGQPALWLTHTKDLAEQAADRAASVLALKRGEIGMIGAGRERVGNKLTIGIIQKMVRMDLSPLTGRFGTVVIDEIQHSPSYSWKTVIEQFPARYRFGWSATPERADGLEIITERVIGPTLYVITRDQVNAACGIVTPQLVAVNTGCESTAWKRYEERVKRYKEHGWQPPAIPFADVLHDVLFDDRRNMLIVDTLARVCPGHSSLVLSERVSHCETLAGMLRSANPDLCAAVIHGRLSKTERRGILEAMNAGELDVLFAVDIAKEGLDIPRLDRLFLVAGGRNEAEIEQKVGRIQRPFPGKTDAVVFDFVDERIPVLRAQYWARRKVYKRLGMIGERQRASG